MESLKNIIERPIEGPHDVAEMEFVVAEYIRARKKVTVIVNICKGIPVPMPMAAQRYYMNQVNQLSRAFNYAWSWFRENPEKL